MTDQASHPRPAPTGVRLMMEDGTELPVECYYSHQDDSGLAVWVVTLEPVHVSRLVGMRVGVLPGHTAVVARVSG